MREERALRQRRSTGRFDSMTSLNGSPGTGNGSAGRKKRLGIALSIVAILLIYIASPYVSLWRLTEALRAGDTEAFASRVDFPRVRESIKAQLIARFFPPEATNTKKDRVRSLIANLAPSLIDQVLDAYLTPDGLALLLAKPETTATKASALAGPPQSDFERLNVRTNIQWSKVRYVFSTTPIDFVVDWNGTKLRFRFHGLGWRLRGIHLPPAQPKK